VVGFWRTGWTHVQRGDTEAGLRYCEEALALSPSPFDAAMAKAAQGYGQVKAGELAVGTARLEEAVAWFDRSHLPRTYARFALCLGEAYVRQARPAEARALFERALGMSRELGYRYFEGVAHRLLGESLVTEAPPAAAQHLEAATKFLEEVDARNEYAKTLVAQAELRRRQGDVTAASQLLERALAIFEKLGTLDEPARVRAVLAALQEDLPA
jgi:tetratricopeptide (TPR) repeat protein